MFALFRIGPCTSRCSSLNSIQRVCRLQVLLHQSRLFAEKRRGKRKYAEPVIVKDTKSKKEVVDIYADMTALELAERVGINFDTITELLVDIDKHALDLAADNRPLHSNTILKAVAAMGFKPRIVKRISVKTEKNEDLFPLPPAPDRECTIRPPVVTIMGHVDHGKTTLLDALRNSTIVESEFGGITQHIGAFCVDLKNCGRQVTFIDTPGHAAFSAMRSRGAHGADIVVLVVAADDGVKEQTVQSIKFAKDAGVPIVVAVNKCDKPNADPSRAKRSLLEHGIVTEDLGGDIQCVEISALHRKNLDLLQDAILVQADLMNLKAPTKGLAEAVVIESSFSHGLGKVCTMIVTRGTLTKNSILVAGTSYCRVRTMTDENGRAVSKALPSIPVRISGWKDTLPSPGDIVLEASDANEAQRAVSYRSRKQMEAKAEQDWQHIESLREEERKKYLANRQKLLDKGYRFGSTLRRIVHKENRFEKDSEVSSPNLSILVRSDVDGTLQAILDVIATYDSDQCKLNVVDIGVGNPTEKDVEIARETGAIIMLFNTNAGKSVKLEADKHGVRIESFNVIYRLVEALKAELSACLPLKTELNLVGEGHVLKEFMISDRGRKRQPIAGCLIDWGTFNRSHIFKFMRFGKPFFEGSIESMKCNMEVVAEAKTNTEVGIALSDKNIRFKEDDTIEVYEKQEIAQTIEWKPPGFS